MLWIFIGAIILTAALAFDFSRHCVEFDLTRDWTAADWALFRSYKRKIGQKNLSLAKYCNLKLREKNEPIVHKLKLVKNR